MNDHPKDMNIAVSYCEFAYYRLKNVNLAYKLLGLANKLSEGKLQWNSGLIFGIKL